MFEEKIIEFPCVTDQASSGRVVASGSKTVIRIGFMTEGGLPILGDTKDSVCFDHGGNWHYNKKTTNVASKFFRDETIAVLLNLHETSVNAGTVSLFRNG